jgi:AcrR family transcriptional regulator
MQETLSMVAEKGLGGTSVIDIEAAAGLSPGSGAFYRHFHSKEEALAAAVRHEVDRLRDPASWPRPDAASAVDDRPSPASLANELLDGINWLNELSPLIRVVLREGKNYPEAAAGLREAIARGGMTAGLDSAARAARTAGRDTWTTAVIVTMASVGYHLATEFFEGPVEGVDAGTFAAALAELVMAVPAPLTSSGELVGD